MMIGSIEAGIICFSLIQSQEFSQVITGLGGYQIRNIGTVESAIKRFYRSLQPGSAIIENCICQSRVSVRIRVLIVICIFSGRVINSFPVEHQESIYQILARAGQPFALVFLITARTVVRLQCSITGGFFYHDCFFVGKHIVVSKESQ